MPRASAKFPNALLRMTIDGEDPRLPDEGDFGHDPWSVIPLLSLATHPFIVLATSGRPRYPTCARSSANRPAFCSATYFLRLCAQATGNALASL